MVLEIPSEKFAVVHNVNGPGTAAFFCHFSDLDNLEFNPLLDILKVHYNEQGSRPLSFEFRYLREAKEEDRIFYRLYELNCIHNSLVTCVILMD